MRSRRPTYKKRKFKSTSRRKLSISDLTVLEFLWTWKVASEAMLAEVAFPGKSPWWIYKALRQLRREKYIELLPRGKNLEQELWSITDHGFEVVLMDRDDIKHYRYRVHAPAHDYLATCLQLGDLWQSPLEKKFHSEQLLASLAEHNFPEGFKRDQGHIPDGITEIPKGLKNIVIGYEVDLNLKDSSRYVETGQYYQNQNPANLIVWLVKNQWMANRILGSLSIYHGESEKERLLRRFAFVTVDDFKKRIWGAEVIMGLMKGMSIRKLHTNLMQTLGKEAPNIGQKEMREIFFPKFRSPQKSFTYKKGGDLKIY